MPPSATILLVDDSRFFLTIERQFLRSAPVALLEAQSAGQALALCRQSKPDLIYMAHDMPDQSGADCCRQLKADPQLRAIPVVLVCDGQRPEQLDLCRAAGCDAVLTKPLERRRFLEIGRSFLAGIRESRRPCLIRVRFQTAGKVCAAKGLDISHGGMFVESAELPAAGEFLQMEIQLCRPGETGPWIACTGMVAWLNSREQPLKPNHPVGFGVKFADLPVQSAAVLNGYLKALERG
jgi:CheY-like chemotaxis protein